MKKYNKEELTKLVEKPREKMVEIEKELFPLEDKVEALLRKHNLEIEKIVKILEKYYNTSIIIIDKRCEDSVIENCYFDVDKDPDFKSCLVCGEPSPE